MPNILIVTMPGPVIDGKDDFFHQHWMRLILMLLFDMWKEILLRRDWWIRLKTIFGQVLLITVALLIARR